MAREVDDKKTKRALRKLARAKAKAAEGGEDAKLSDWENEFVDSVETRLETYGSAFNDPEKGKLDEPLSALQSFKLREIEKKASGKARKPMSRGAGFKAKPGSGFKRSSFKSKSSGPRVRDINDDVIGAVPETPEPKPAPPPDPEPDPALRPKPKPARPALRVVKGGKDDN
ncbi:hypothetical protein [Hyphobacterium marinum]|uniref:Uncharacterized protein n=1 Tax=Hyphobacterium marinum TaxID=3116574 RepID=A0ABU7LYI6_9PROT|nr:hypothetical protein [Hyphobacterium sp. Y6023]MEE2566521.1 hypothetical protein [Hyphobacterium sp. Y6023]